MKIRDIVVSVVVPVQNDASILLDRLNGLLSQLETSFEYFEIVVVDDGSTDESARIANAFLGESHSIRYVQFTRTFGFDVAASAGLETAIGDYVVVMCLREDPAAVVSRIVEKARESDGIVIGVSTVASPDGFFVTKMKSVFHWYLRKYLKIEFVPRSTNLICLSRAALNAVTSVRDRYRYIRLILATVSSKQSLFYYEPLSVQAPQSFLSRLQRAADIIVSNSMHPLRFASRISIAAATVNLLYLAYVVSVYFFKENVAEGWTTLSLQHGVMFLLMFIILSILGEYIGRTLDETKNRPLYFIQTEKFSSVQIRKSNRLNVEVVHGQNGIQS